MSKHETFDYIIVGAGSAGAVVASRLSEDPSLKILLVEAGCRDSSYSLHVPGAIVRNVANPRFNWGYQTEPQEQLAHRQLFWPRGKLLGGSSSINGMLYVRGDHWDYDQWSALGCEGWAFADVLPFFKKAEASARGASEWHGEQGPLRVMRGEPGTPVCSAFLAAAKASGYPLNDDFNGSSQEGFGHYDCTIHNGRRFSTATAYLKPASHRNNLSILTDALAARVVFDADVARGVDMIVNGQTHRYSADREVILCGGAINSPQLLMLSGIGPADHLRSAGIRVFRDIPDVGTNLQDHIAYKYQIACPLPVTAYKYMNPMHAFGAGIRYLLKGDGILGRTALPTGGFFRTSTDAAVPDIQIHLSVALVSAYGRKFPDRHGFTVYVNQGRPRSRGHIRLRSTDPTAAPVIDPKYFSEPSDLDVLVDGMRATEDIIRHPSLAPYVGTWIDPDERVRGRDACIDDIRQKATSTYHPVGTCRMGGDAGSVVDPQLRVRGVTGLRVVDASVMPTLINGNTNAPTIMIAEKAANMIRQTD